LNFAIVIGTSLGRSGWVTECLASLKNQNVIPVDVISSQNFELSVIDEAASKYEEFIYVPDSTEFLDFESLVDNCFGTKLSVSLSSFPVPFGMYLGKYLAEHVKQIGVPRVANKLDAVRYEAEWTAEYAALAPYKELGTLPHTDVFVEKHGRVNMVTESQWIRRWKGCWNAATMHRENDRILKERE